MKTIVYQSFRTRNIPAWINDCLQSVEAWARSHGFEYSIIDDRLFECVPAWYREKVGGNVLLLSDLGRLILAREFLQSGYDRVIWVDADVLIFSPLRFDIGITSEYLFCNEVWLHQMNPREWFWRFVTSGRAARIICSRRVNNAVAVFTAGNSLLDFYISAAESVVRNRSQKELTPWTVGVGFLTRLHAAIKIPLLDTVGQLSPLVCRDVAEGGTRFVSLYGRALQSPVFAANLCSSLVGKRSYGVSISESMILRAMHNLTSSQGKAINQFVQRTALQ
jgi:hypothetical protein